MFPHETKRNAIQRAVIDSVRDSSIYKTLPDQETDPYIPAKETDSVPERYQYGYGRGYFEDQLLDMIGQFFNVYDDRVHEATFMDFLHDPKLKSKIPLEGPVSEEEAYGLNGQMVRLMSWLMRVYPDHYPVYSYTGPLLDKITWHAVTAGKRAVSPARYTRPLVAVGPASFFAPQGRQSHSHFGFPKVRLHSRANGDRRPR